MAVFALASETNGPWILATQRTIAHKDIPRGIMLLELDATLMTDLEKLHREFAAAFEFPDYYGNNVNALDDCITDLEWLPADGYLLVIRNAEVLLDRESPDALGSILSILDDAGSEWATPVEQGEAWDRSGVPFHTVLEMNKGQASRFQLRLKELGLEIDSL